MRGLAHRNGQTKELPWVIIPLCLPKKNNQIMPCRNLNAKFLLIFVHHSYNNNNLKKKKKPCQ